MSNNPFMDYQEQFFKMWEDNMQQMLESDAYKAMAQNIPGSDAYTKAMESMVPNIENYWKTMAASFPAMPENNPVMDYWKNMMPASNPAMDYWTNMMKGSNPVMDFWNNMPTSNPFMDYWKEYADKMPDFSEYWKAYTDLFPAFQSYWDNIAKMMPDPEKFAEMAPFKIPGFESFTKVFDMWKSFGDPTSMVQDFQTKYMDATAEIIKSLFPENVQAFVAKPMDFMNAMVEYYKQFVSPWVEIDSEIMDRLAAGDPDAYIDFFKEYQEKYAENLEKYYTVLGMGLNREANADYMGAMNEWNKAMISMGELLAVVTKTSQESFDKIAETVQKDLAEGKSITTFRDFYTIWYSVTEEAYEKLLATDEFAKVFDDFADRYAQFMIAQNKVYERMLSSLPIPTNTDMKALYKTVYDLRKDVRDLKKAVAAPAAPAAKDEKKGDK